MLFAVSHFTWLFLCVALLPTEAVVSSPPLTIIPAYFYPSGGVCGGALGYWDCVAYAAKTSPAVGGGGIIIANPNNGPGSSLDTNYAAAINATLAAGDQYRNTLAAIASADPAVTSRVGSAVWQRPAVQIAGYVRTGYGSRAASAVLADAATWMSLYNVSSFFLDECTTTVAQSAAFITMAKQVRAMLPPGGTGIICNFGTVPDTENFTNACDVMIVHEDYGYNFAAAASAAWMSSYPPTRFAVLYHTLSNATQMRSMLSIAMAGGMGGNFGGPLYAPGYFYATDKALNPNPWDALPSFWWSECAVQTVPFAIRTPSYTQSTIGFLASAVSTTTPTRPRYVDTALALGSTTMRSNIFVSDVSTAYASQYINVSASTSTIDATTSSSGFIVWQWRLTYGLSLSSLWFPDSTAAAVSDAILAGKAFVRITSVSDLAVGDLLVVAWKAPTVLPGRDAGSTGYVAILLNVTRRAVDSAPIVAGTVQYDVCVADSTATPHGSSDVRYGGGSAGGIGSGCLRLYANTSSNYTLPSTGLVDQTLGRIDALNASFENAWCGMAWSADSTEVYMPFTESTQYLVVGRPLPLELLFDLDTAVTTTTTTAVTPALSTTALASTTLAPPSGTDSPTPAPMNGTTNGTANNSTTNGTTSAPATAAPFFTSAAIAVLPIRLCTFKYAIRGNSFISVIDSPLLAPAVVEDVATDFQLIDYRQVNVVSLAVGSLLVTVDINATNASAPADQVKALQARYISAAHDFPTVRALYRSVNPSSTESLQTISIEISNVYVAPNVMSVSTCNFACGVFVAVVVIAIAAIVGISVCVWMNRPATNSPSGTTVKASATPPTAAASQPSAPAAATHVPPHLRSQPPSGVVSLSSS